VGVGESVGIGVDPGIGVGVGADPGIGVGVGLSAVRGVVAGVDDAAVVPVSALASPRTSHERGASEVNESAL
jgi:hypothetical protein